MRFTQDEFKMMADELLNRKTVSFDMLCKIADKTLRPAVLRWCGDDDSLRGRGLEEDLMQEIKLHLMKVTVPFFLLRDGLEGKVNDDHEGFEDWLFTVAKNTKHSFARKRRLETVSMDTLEEEPATGETPEETAERIDQLRAAFDIVLSADAGVHKVLTWVAHSVFMLQENLTKIQTNELLLETFENKTLSQMYDMVVATAAGIPWMEITPAQHTRILLALSQPWDESRCHGQVRYREFFMKVAGEPSGKKSISDWMNRMNKTVQRKLDETLARRAAAHPAHMAGRSEYAPSDS